MANKYGNQQQPTVREEPGVRLSAEAQEQAAEIERVEKPRGERELLKAWEESHARYAEVMVNGSHVDENGEKYAPVKTACACDLCVETRAVLGG